MTAKRAIFTCLLAALAALLLTLWLREDPPVIHATASAPSPAPASSAARESGRAAAPATPEVRDTAPALHGLRRLPEAEAERRGWKRPDRDKHLENARKAWALLEQTMVSVNYQDVLLEDVCRDLLTRYQLSIRIDPRVPKEQVSVTFRVDDLRADQFLLLMTGIWHDPANPVPMDPEEFSKWHEDGLTIVSDEEGMLWVKRKSQVTVNNPLIRQAYAVATAVKPGKLPDELRSETLAGRTATVSIVHEPVETALKTLLRAAGLSASGGWSPEARKKAEEAPLASLIGENLPADKALEELLAGPGLALIVTADEAWVCTRDEYRDYCDERTELTRKWATGEADTASLRKREVRIEGNCLSLGDAAAQLTAQLGEPVIVDPRFEDLVVHWESDGLAQPAGEVLDILARDARLMWRLASPGFEAGGLPDVKGIWFVAK